jgi:hypothetical protein
MRALSIACVLSILPVSALADTLQVLSPPSPAPYHQPGTPQLCAAINFATDGSVNSACKYTTGGSCGRFCHPAQTLYVATSNPNGLEPMLGPVCGKISAGLTGHQITTYVSPYTAATCTVDFSPLNETVVVDGYTFQFVTTRTDGAELLDLNNGASYLWTPTP